MTVELRVHGDKLTGFQSGSVQLSMDGAYNSFDVSYLASGKQPGERSLFAGDPCELLIAEQSVLVGYVDTTDDDDRDNEIRLTASGRSKTADLVDCSAAHGSYSNAKLSTIAASLAKPFGVEVFVEGDEGAPFPRFAVDKGESVVDAILRGAIKRGLHLYAVGGSLVLGRAGVRSTETWLVRGERPLMRSARSDSMYSRYSHYVFRGQVPSTDRTWGKNASQLERVVLDGGVKRYRPLMLQVETDGPGTLKTRAEVERNHRAAQGERITALVEGHTTVEGWVWRPNVLVRFRNAVLGVDATLLVVAASFRFGADELDTTELLLSRPQAFDLVNYPALQRGATWT